jgi:hypothetical protein
MVYPSQFEGLHAIFGQEDAISQSLEDSKCDSPCVRFVVGQQYERSPDRIADIRGGLAHLLVKVPKSALP